jgi:hypothetical protein
VYTPESDSPIDLIKLMLQLHLEPLFYKYHVDVNLYAHQHFNWMIFVSITLDARIAKRKRTRIFFSKRRISFTELFNILEQSLIHIRLCPTILGTTAD